MAGSLTGQKAIVTGANSGIGRATALALASAGADVVVNYVDHPEAAEEIAGLIRAKGRSALAVRADVANEAETIAMFRTAVAAFGTIDILVANAGLQDDSPIASMSLSQWRRVIDVNLTGQFLCAREAIREFVRRGVVASVSAAAGKIICMSSVHQIIPWAGHVNYAASKGGLHMLMKSLAQEVAPHRIRVNAIAPGAIRTPINESVWSDPARLESLLALVPYGRIGEPDEVARAAVWLASDESDYVVGTTLTIDGGMTLFPGFAANG